MSIGGAHLQRQSGPIQAIALAAIAFAGVLGFAEFSDAQQMSRRPSATAGSGSAAGSAAGSGSGTMAPYAGMQSREIPSLSDREIADLKLGRGMGFALPAELNGYPGPLHVLEMADALRLTKEQKAQTQQIFDWMKSQAEALGSSLVAAEAQLGAAFRDRKIDKSRLDELVKAAERIRAELRAVHLSAHIEQAAALTDYQRDVYAAARGYLATRFTRGAQGAGSGSGSGSGSESASASSAGGMCGGGSGAGGGCCCSGGGCGGAASQASMSCRPRQASE